MIDLTNPNYPYHLYRIADKRPKGRTGLLIGRSDRHAKRCFARLYGLDSGEVTAWLAYTLDSGETK